MIIYRICKNIYVFCFNFLFFNEMICIFVSVIKILLEYEKANYTFLCLFVNRHKSAIAQAVQVTGVVMSAEDDMPVVGASILVKGTSNGTITDIDGKFILKVNKGDKLEISYIGMKSQTVAAKNNMKVVLESDTEVLDEVVVTGMQRMDKRLFTGASTKISAEDSKLDGVPEISRALEGRAAGVSVQNVSGTFGTAPKIRVRGLNIYLR